MASRHSAIFDIQCREIQVLVSSSEDDKGVNFCAEIGLIGLAAYFEGFFRGLFSALVNICPELLEDFSARRPDFSIPIRDIISVGTPLSIRLGFLVGERLDFGSAKSINAAFGDLLQITPLSKDEAGRFQEFLRTRNLVVHYGGIHTMKYAEADRGDQAARRRVFVDSVSVKKGDVHEWCQFLSSVALKTTTAAREALTGSIAARQIYVAEGERKALELLAERL